VVSVGIEKPINRLSISVATEKTINRLPVDKAWRDETPVVGARDQVRVYSAVADGTHK
jgi:hypothetical protein